MRARLVCSSVDDDRVSICKHAHDSTSYLLPPPAAVVLMVATCMPSWHRQFIARIVTDPRGWGEGGFHFIPLSGDSTLNAAEEEAGDGAQGRAEGGVTEVCSVWEVHVGVELAGRMSARHWA